VQRVYEQITFRPEEPADEVTMIQLLIQNLCTWFFMKMGNTPGETHSLVIEVITVLNKGGLEADAIIKRGE